MSPISVRYLENRAYEAIDSRTKLERKQATAERRHGRKNQSLAKKLSYARPAEAKAIALADEVALLAYVWGGRDLRAVAPRSDSANFPGFFSILCSVFRDSVVTIFRVIS